MENRVIKAKEGKVFRRISDGFIMGKEIHLGYTYYINGKKLETPLLELPEHFEEIDEPILELPGHFEEIDEPMEVEDEFRLE